MANRTYCMLIDIKRDIFEIIKLKPIDTGNVLHIKFSEDGKPVDLTGQTVKFMAKKPDGTGVYNFANVIDAKAGEIEVEITNQMTAVDGELDCEIEIEGKELITTMTFYITVDRKLNDGEFIESTNEFTVLQKAIRDAYEAIELMETKTDAKLEQLQSQVNTAISNMNSTTNTKLAQLQAQVNTAIEGMNETTDTKLADLQQQVTTAIASMNSKTDTKLSQVQSQVDNKLTAIQGQVDTLGSTLTKKVNDKITEVTGTQNTLTSKVDAKIVELTNAVNAKITEHTSTINSKVAEVNSKLQTVNNKISEVNSTVSNANATVTVLKQDVATAIAGIDTKIDSKLATKADKDHNHDTSYLKLSGGTLTGNIKYRGGGYNNNAIQFVAGDANGAGIGVGAGGLTAVGSGESVNQVMANVSTTTEVLHLSSDQNIIFSTGIQNGWANRKTVEIKTDGQIYVEGNKVYHAGNKPTPADIGASASNHTHTSLQATSLSGQTVSLDTYTLASGSPQVAHYYCPTDGGGSGITGRPNDSTKNAFSLKVELIRWASTTDYITKQTYIRGNEKIIYVRYCTSGTWSAWEKVYTSSNKPTPADIGASATSHNHDTAYLGKTAKAESAKVADSANAVAWDNISGKPSSFSPASHNHDSTYLKLAGGTMTGKITTSHNTSTYLQGNQGNAIINSSTSAGAYVMLYRYPSTNGYFTMGGYQGKYLLQYTAQATVDAGTNGVTKSVTLLDESGNTSFAGTVTAPTFSGSLSGNASTATKLQTARTINGTSFDGTGNITTANWGTARTITIGNTAKSVNGSGNVSWSLSEIGASASSHTHSYLPLSGGTLTGALGCSTISATGTITTNGGVTAYGTVQGYDITATNKATLVGFEVSSKQNSSGSWYNRIAPIGSDGVMEIGKYLDWHYSGTETKDYHSRMSLMDWDCMEFSGAIKVNGTIYPGMNLQPGWDIGQNGSRFYTVYCNNVNQSSDRNLKEDIVYVNDKVSVFSKMKTSTPFKDFLTGDLKIATYKYKRENKLSEEELERNPEGTALEYRDEDNQIGFIAQDIINTDIGSTFVYGEDGSMNYSPSGFTAVVAKALQEEIAQRDAEIAELKTRLAIIEEKLGVA